jgi:hypothetical protein
MEFKTCIRGLVQPYHQKSRDFQAISVVTPFRSGKIVAFHVRHSFLAKEGVFFVFL